MPETPKLTWVDRPSFFLIDFPAEELRIGSNPHNLSVAHAKYVLEIEKILLWQRDGHIRQIPHDILRNVLRQFQIWSKQMALDPRTSAPVAWNVIYWWQTTPLQPGKQTCQPRPRRETTRPEHPNG